MPRRHPVQDFSSTTVVSREECPYGFGGHDTQVVHSEPLDMGRAADELAALQEEQPHSRAKLEIDKVRPFVTSHLLSPLLHHLVVQTVDTANQAGLQKNVTDNMAGLQQHAGQYSRKGFRRRQDADMMVHALKMHWFDFALDNIVPVSQTFTLSQRAVMLRCYSLSGGVIDNSMLAAGDTVFDTTREIEHRHRRLKLHNCRNMADFLRDPQAVSVMRGIAAGASGFPDSLRGRNADPVGEPWRANPNKPYIEIRRRGRIRIAPELLRAARTNRKQTEALEQEAWPMTGLQNIHSRYSDGCPMRHLGFRVGHEVLEGLGIGLTPEQTSMLTEGDRPTAAIDASSGKGRIQRDGMAAMCINLADMVDAATAA